MLYLKGDELAFKELERRHHNRLLNYFRHHCVHNENDRFDLLQNAWLVASRIIRNGRYDFSLVFAAWITRIAQIMIKRHFDKKNPRKNLQYGFEEENDRRSSEQSLHIDDHWLREALLVLTAHEREVFSLRFELGMSYQKIGEKLGIEARTASHIYSFALHKMKKFLEEHGIQKGDL